MRPIHTALALIISTLLLAPGVVPARAENFFTPFGKAIRQFTDPQPAAPARVSKPKPPVPAAEIEAPVPETRPAAAQAEPVEPKADAPVPPPRDRPVEVAPETPAATEPAAPPSKDDEVTVNKGDEAPPPKAAPSEPPPVYQTACPAMTMGAVEGKVLPPLHEGQCGIQTPLSITGVSVNGRMVPLSGEAVTDCAMATMLPAWASQVDGYLWAKDNTRLTGINVGTSYLCRNRVGGASTDKLSEHSFADALDVVGFTLEDGRTIDVASGWPGSEEQGSLVFRHAHDAACSLFMTTLGPDANGEHHDHLHLDMGCHGKTCTARLCQ